MWVGFVTEVCIPEMLRAELADGSFPECCAKSRLPPLLLRRRLGALPANQPETLLDYLIFGHIFQLQTLSKTQLLVCLHGGSRTPKPFVVQSGEASKCDVPHEHERRSDPRPEKREPGRDCQLYATRGAGQALWIGCASFRSRWTCSIQMVWGCDKQLLSMRGPPCFRGCCQQTR